MTTRASAAIVRENLSRALDKLDEDRQTEMILRVRNLSVEFDGQAVLRDVSFDVKQAESVAVIGPNGSGKTVLLKSLLGLIPYAGEVLWMTGVTIGYVPQKIQADRSLPLTARNLLESKARVIGRSVADIEEAIARAGLSSDVVAKQVGNLSGGQFQRTLIALALLGLPKIVLLDEPTASIDEPGEERIFALIHHLQVQEGLSFVVASHDLSFVYQYANRVLCLNRTALCYGPPKGVLTPELLGQLFESRSLYHHTHEA
jgi:zinc transport system ATP-binding protein